MRVTRRTLLGAVAATAALAGCAGGDDAESPGTGTTASPETTVATTTPSPETTTATTTEAANPAVQVATHADLGEILVGPEGLTLYMFDQDTNGEAASTCYDSCAGIWPPLTVTGSATTGDGVTAAVETFEREGGDRQVMAGGWPLYYYASDSSPGDAAGQGVNGVWWALRPDGTPVRSTATTDGIGY
jgi:predicted lipoprotein with Yx(FWY)xxD motif